MVQGIIIHQKIGNSSNILRQSILFIICINLLLPHNNLYSEEYTEFNFEKGIWIEAEYNYGDFADRQIYCSGDTILNEQSFHKLYESAIVVTMPGGIPDTTIHQYLGAIRENDSKQVLFQGGYNTEPEIIYDFNLQIGDTVRLWAQYNIVDSIDSVEVCGKIRNRYWINGISRHESIIEGVGFSNGLLGYNRPSSQIGESYYRLKCYTEKLNSSCAECSLVLKHNNISLSSMTYPNPAQNVLHIKAPRLIQAVMLNDVNGRCFHSQQNIRSYTHTIDMTNCKPGLYTIIMIYDNNICHSEIIIKE